MTGFALLYWQDQKAKARAFGLVRAFEASGLTRCGSGPAWTCLASCPGTISDDLLLLGTIYDRNGQTPSNLTSGLSGLDAAARRLATECWGRYIAVWTSGAPRIMIDPSGAWPLWQLQAPGLTFITDRVTPALARLAGLDTVISRKALAATLLDTGCSTHLSYIDGITPLLPGTLVDLEADASSSAWDPATAVSNGPGDLRKTIDLAVASMSSDAGLQLSGGLDSAIVLSSAVATGNRLHALNVATTGAGADERHYARLVADHCGTACDERIVSGFPDLSRIARQAQSVVPFAFGLDAVFEDAVDMFAADLGASAMLTGQGGDAVFFQPATSLVAVDRARQFGFGRSTWPFLLDDARRTQRSVWHHFWPALRDRFRPATIPDEPLSPHLLTSDGQAWAAAVDRRHPWLREIAHLPPGKRMQIAMIANSQIFHRPRANGVTPLRHPLLAQPVVEAALAIPTYELCCGDNDRGLARQLFADRLPTELIARRSKGDASDHYSRAALSSLDFLRDYLLDGELVRLGILNRERMEQLLTHEGLFHSLDYRGLPMQVSCEAWARAWRSDAG